MKALLLLTLTILCIILRNDVFCSAAQLVANGTQATDASSSYYSHVATLDANKFVIIYPNPSFDIWLSYYDNYTKLSGYNISPQTAISSANPRVLALNTSTVVAVWQSSNGIRGRICGLSSCSTSDFRVDNSTYAGNTARIASFGPSQFIVAYLTTSTAWIRIFQNSDGTALTPPVLVVNNDVNFRADVVSYWNGVEWSWILVYDGKTVATMFTKTGYVNGTFGAARNLGLPGGSYVSATNSNGHPQNIWALTYTSSAKMYFAALYSNCTLYSSGWVNASYNDSWTSNPSAISALPNGNFAVVYDTYIDSDWGVSTMIMLSNGSRYFPSDVRLSDSSNGLQLGSTVAGFSGGGPYQYVAAWYDQTNGNTFKISNLASAISPSPSPSNSPSPVTPSVSPTPSISVSPSSSSTPSSSPSRTPSPSLTPTTTPSLSPSASSSPSSTPSISVSPSSSPTPSISISPSSSPTPSISITPSSSQVPSASSSNSPSINAGTSSSTSPNANNISPSASPASNNSTESSNRKSASSTPIIAGVVGAVGCSAIYFGSFFVFIKWRKQRRGKNHNLDMGGENVELHITPSSSSAGSTTNTVKKYPDMEKGWKISYDDVKLKEELGRGAFGVVYKCEWRNTDCVIKLLNVSAHTNEATVYAFLREAHNVKNLRNHPNVCSILGICTDPVAIVMEYVSGGSLLSCMANKKIQMTPTRIVKFAKDIASGMSHLHAENIIHLDLACRNLLVAFSLNDCSLKITDFGLSRIIDSDTYTASKEATFPIRWTAPEALNMRIISRACDVWSFGITLWEMIERQIPYQHIATYDVIQHVENGNRLSRPSKVPIPDSLWELMLLCWSEAPGERPSFTDICTRLKSIEEEALLMEKIPNAIPSSSSLEPSSEATSSGPYYTLMKRGNDSAESEATYGNQVEATTSMESVIAYGNAKTT